jgi:uncharacterized protein YdeI (YjbR/CyaY-like superfamily)
MKITNTICVTNRHAWRDWLKEHYHTDKEVWLVYPRKPSGKPRIPYNDAVEEALCFGWIDSTVKTLDAEATVQKFSPRKRHAVYSQTNKERLARLIKQQKVMTDVLETLGNLDGEAFEIPADIGKALKANKRAWRNFQRYSGPYQRIRIAFIAGARNRPEEFKKRLSHFLRMTEQNKQFGFGIESYY